jgi:8-oxo-dGDP phosphatase
VSGSGQVADRAEAWPVTDSVARFTGSVIRVRSDTVRMPDGACVRRDVVMHPGAVGVVALDGQGRVLVLQQYRHPPGQLLWEPPAGLLDVPGEDPWLTAQRELYEEAHYRAADWRVLVDVLTTPGSSNESIRIFLARELTAVPDGERHVGVHEEADMPLRWVGVEDLVAGVLAGRLHNPVLVSGVLALQAARSGAGLDALRQPDATWSVRP